MIRTDQSEVPISEAIIEAVARAIDEAGGDAKSQALAAICAMRAICKSCVQEFDLATGHACSGQAATPAAPVQDDDLLTINEFVQKHASVRDLSVRAAFRRIEARLSPDRSMPNDDPMARDAEEWLRAHPSEPEEAG